MTHHPGLVPTDQPTTLEIADADRVLRFDYRQALDFHQGNSYWGCALAFRMLQRASTLLSGKQLWDRNRLQVVSGHPGPGVRDTLELVTGCVTGGRFRLEGGPREARCVGDMEYRWRLSDGATELGLQLADGIVPAGFLHFFPSRPTRIPRHLSEPTRRPPAHIVTRIAHGHHSHTEHRVADRAGRLVAAARRPGPGDHPAGDLPGHRQPRLHDHHPADAGPVVGRPRRSPAGAGVSERFPAGGPGAAGGGLRGDPRTG